MIKDGKSSAVLKYIDKYEGLDISVAERIIKKGVRSDVENLLDKIDSFKIDNRELLALSLIESGYGDNVINSITPTEDKWSKIVTDSLLDKASMSIVEDFLLAIDDFDIEPNDAAIKIITKHKNAGALAVINELTHQHKLSDKVAYEIITQGKLHPTVSEFLDQLDNFNIDRNLALHKVLDCHHKEGAHLISENLVSIENIDIKIAYRLIEFGETKEVLLFLDHFVGSKDSEFLLHILSNMTSEDEITYLSIDDFGSLNSDIAIKLIDLGKISEIYLYLDKFKNLSKQIAQILFEDNSKSGIYTDDILESLDSFTYDAKEYLKEKLSDRYEKTFEDEEQDHYTHNSHASEDEYATLKSNIKSPYYEILEVEINATHLEIKKAYRQLISKHHPDKGGDEILAKRINEAYATLGNPEKRRLYDLQHAYDSGSTQEEAYHAAENQRRSQSDTVNSTHEEATKQSWNPDVVAGSIWLGIGLLITIGTYVAASDMGGHYVISFGPIVYGLYRLGKSL